MTVFLIITEIVLILCRALTGYFAAFAEWLEPLQTPLTVICIVVGIMAAAFVAVRLYKEITGGKPKDGK